MLDVNVLETCTCFCHNAFFEIILKTLLNTSINNVEHLYTQTDHLSSSSEHTNYADSSS